MNGIQGSFCIFVQVSWETELNMSVELNSKDCLEKAFIGDRMKPLYIHSGLPGESLLS